MPLFCIGRHALGEQLDLCVTDGGYRWSDGIPPDTWALGDSSSVLDLSLLAKLSGMTIRDVPERFRVAFKSLGHTGPVRWRQAMPENEFRAYIDGMLESIRTLLNSGCVGYYTEVFRRARECLGALGRARIDGGRLVNHIAVEANETNRSALQSFTPDSDGWAPRVSYDQVATVTGRLVVSGGPRILTLPKRCKDIITSRYEGGTIVSLDYSSLEPRVILGAQGRVAPRDIYAEMCDVAFSGALTRAQAKAVTISLLYGARDATISRASGLTGQELRRAIEGVSQFFTIDALSERLLEEARQTGIIRNYYGRPIIIGDRKNLMNYYAQSTAVDAALLGFASAVELIKRDALEIIPLFVIHDALMLDVHPDFVGYIEIIARQCGQIRGFNVEFPVRCEEMKRA